MTIVRIWDSGIPIHEERFKDPIDAHPYAAYVITKLQEHGYEPVPNEKPGIISLYSEEKESPAEIQILEIA